MADDAMAAVYGNLMHARSHLDGHGMAAVAWFV